ncbi:hypothetical protein [Chamaesiphon polymorphus]|uniref:Uncharacterized protein n=1 Tax=Chamaesiphon polymorphus CCALA 037 TaxID=2107692 RepID=A0A2T1GHF3_9CYAN|nr:hypothetical protein [Chamaesiphon polymorphus]PSB57124.1 hypothetical protein C7B77_09475 [Chamaesiphon polymorphus CCALA 037]
MEINQIDLQIIEELTVKFADIPEAIASLETIADCEGDLEDAAMTLAIRTGQQPDITNSEWLEGLAKKCRVAVCQSEFRNDMVDGNFMPLYQHFERVKVCPKLLILPVLLYVHEHGVNRFCQPLDPL